MSKEHGLGDKELEVSWSERCIDAQHAQGAGTLVARLATCWSLQRSHGHSRTEVG